MPRSARHLLTPILFACALVRPLAAQPVNDDCSSATTVTSPGIYPATTENASGLSGSGCGVGDIFDVWYSFTAPQDGAYRFDLELSPGYVAASMVLYDSCDSPAILCDSGPSSGPTAGKPRVEYFLGAGQSIKIRVAMCCFDRWPFTLRVGPGTAPARPANDDCAAAIAAPLDAPITGTNLHALGSGDSAPCVFGYRDLHDVWYAFTAPQAGLYEFAAHGIASASASPFYTTLALYDACGGPQVACGDDFDPRVGSRILHTLAAGQSVRVRVAGYAAGEGTFTLRIARATPPAPPANDTCQTAQAIGLPSSASVAIAGATDDLPLSCWGGPPHLGVWYTFVPARDTNVFVLNDTALPVAAAIFSGSCESPVEEACFQIIPGRGYFGPDGLDVQAGRRYWLLMSHAGEREVSADAALAPRLLDRGNDLCTRATPLAFPASTEGSNFAYHDEGVVAGCGAGQSIDAWYELVAPRSARYRFELLNHPAPPLTPMESPVLSLFDACNGNELACNDIGAASNSLATVTALLGAGQRVLVRVASTDLLAGTFALEVWSDAPAGSSPNDDCATAAALSPGLGAKPITVAGRTASASQRFDGSFAWAASGLASPALLSDAWYAWTAPTAGILRVRTNIVGLGIAVYAGSACPPAPSALLNATVNDHEMSMAVSAGQPLLIQVGALTPGFTAAANLFLEMTPFQGACCSAGGCSVTTSDGCTGSFLGANTACGPVGATPRVLADTAAQTLPEGGTVSRTLTVPAATSFTVGAVAVQTTVNHPQLSDVVLTLSHAGRTVTLMRASDIPNELTGVYVFTDAAINQIAMITDAGAGPYAARAGYDRASDRGVIQSLNDPVTGFGGVPAAGDWVLRASDTVSGTDNRGVLNGWKLVLLEQNASGPCAALTGACCTGSTCSLAVAGACAGANTRFAGSGLACNAPGDLRTPCCAADFDQSGGSSLQDLFSFLQAWFARSPSADADRTGDISVGDLFAFLVVWFGGC